jgi:hypothetical protein
MSNIRVNKDEIDREFRSAVKRIKMENKGLPDKLVIEKNYRIHSTEFGTLRLEIPYIDGNSKHQLFTVGL